MSDAAQENILGTISKLDASMAKMVEQDPDNIQALYSSIRLQIDNLEAKISTLVPSFDYRNNELADSFEDSERFEIEEDYKYYKKLKESEKWFQSKGRSASNLRGYMRRRLEATYFLLKKKHIYKAVSTVGADDLEVVDPGEIEGENEE